MMETARESSQRCDPTVYQESGFHGNAPLQGRRRHSDFGDVRCHSKGDRRSRASLGTRHRRAEPVANRKVLDSVHQVRAQAFGWPCELNELEPFDQLTEQYA